MKSAALGFRAHSGWTALVALSLARGAPCVLARQRIHLVETFTYRFRQPYHTAKRYAARRSTRLYRRTSRLKREASPIARSANSRKICRRRAIGLTRCGLVLASGRPLPDLPDILASHALIHTADGELFREALLHASARCGLLSKTAKERELLNEASRVLRLTPSILTRRIADLGRPLGAPWSQDEKLASLIAWLALASKPSQLRRWRPTA